MARTSILGSVAVKLGMQSKGFEKGLKTAQLSLKRFAKNAESMGKTLSVGVTAPLIGLATKSIMLFDKQAKAVAQVEQGLKSTGNAAGFTSKQLQDMASSLQGITVFGDEDILANVTSQLLTFTNISGEAFERTQKAALDLATRLDGDLKSASIQLGKALNDPVANLSALSRSGIQFTEAQKAVIKELSETNRLAEAQALILDELDKQYGGSAEAARKAGVGGLQALNNSFGDLLERIGGLLLPLLNKLVEFLDGLVTKMANATDEQMKFALGVGIVAAAIGPVVYAVGLLTKAFIALASPIALKIAALALLAAGLNYVYQNAGAFAERFVYAFNVAKEAVLGMTATSLRALGNLLSVFDKAGGMALVGMAAGIESGLGNIEKDFTEFGSFTDSIKDSLSSLGTVLFDLFSSIMPDDLSKSVDAEQKRIAESIRRAKMVGVNFSTDGLLDGDPSGFSQVTVPEPKTPQFTELTNTQIAQAQALAQGFDAISDSFARTFVDGIADLKNFGDAWKAFGKSVVGALKEIAVQLVKMAALKGLASIFGLGGVTTSFGLAQGLFQKFSGSSVGAAGGATAGKQALNANLYIDGQNVRTTYEIANRRYSRIAGV